MAIKFVASNYADRVSLASMIKWPVNYVTRYVAS